MLLRNFESNSLDEMDNEIVARQIDFVDVVSVETLKDVEEDKYRVWYWYRAQIFV